MLLVNLTEVSTLWQVPANEAIGILIRAALPGRIRRGEEASYPDAVNNQKTSMVLTIRPVQSCRCG